MTRYPVRIAISRRATSICLAAVFALYSAPLGSAQQSAAAPSPAPAQTEQPGGAPNTGSQGSSAALPETPAPSQAVSAQAPAGPKQQKGSGAEQQQPVGTAAAGIENTAGVAASKPAGVAIAPPKQRRVRLLVIKVGAILGAGAAVGTVAALSKASPSRPPGAH